MVWIICIEDQVGEDWLGWRGKELQVGYFKEPSSSPSKETRHTTQEPLPCLKEGTAIEVELLMAKMACFA